jgi:acyl carrier protein
MNEMQQTIREFIWTNYLEGKFSIELDGDTRLRSSGLIDSLGGLGIVLFVEKEFDVEFSALELTVDNFDTINQISSLVARKKQ